MEVGAEGRGWGRGEGKWRKRGEMGREGKVRECKQGEEEYRLFDGPGAQKRPPEAENV